MFIFTSRSYSQSVIIGKVEDSTKTSIPFCSLALLNVADSSIVKGNITNEQGEFRFDFISNGQYFLKISYVGFEDSYSALINIDTASELLLPTIQLKIEESSLSEVSVKSFRKTVSFESGKVILNVENDIMASGNYVLELLRKLPGVSIDAQNNISINGKSGVQFLIDGRLQQIPTSQLLTILSNMSSESISTIELIKNPPAKYDASGTGGLINIVTKKAKLKGLNGTLSNSLSHGKGIGEMSNLIINYKNNKWSIFSNLMGSYRNYISTIQANRDYFIPNN